VFLRVGTTGADGVMPGAQPLIQGDGLFRGSLGQGQAEREQYQQPSHYCSGVDFAAFRNCATAASTSSNFEGIPDDSTCGWPLVISTSSSMRTPMPLYFSKAGLTAAMKASFSGVFGRLSKASNRM